MLQLTWANDHIWIRKGGVCCFSVDLFSICCAGKPVGTAFGICLAIQNIGFSFLPAIGNLISDNTKDVDFGYYWVSSLRNLC